MSVSLLSLLKTQNICQQMSDDASVSTTRGNVVKFSNCELRIVVWEHLG